MEDILYYNELYDCYSSLLTDKQRLYFENYYFDNLSLAEIADNLDVSRNAVHKQLQITIEKLEEYEEKLELNKKKKVLDKIIKSIGDKSIKEELEKLI